MDLSVKERIRRIFGEEIYIVKSTPVSGGDINAAFRLDLSNGGSVFLKTNRIQLEDMFRTEAEGLAALASSGVIPAARPLGAGTDVERGCSYLLLEYIREGTPAASFWEEFGRALAGMHRQETAAFVKGGRFGFARDNYIGRTPQSNAAHESFISFFREERLLPQIKKAESYFGKRDLAQAEHMLERLDEILIEPDFPSLLHGDLWSGNFLVGENGKAILIDPAVYVGCSEADLAMTELFGGFSPRFYKAYQEVFPLPYEYEDRRDVYNLYHLLNHLNLFGSAYLSSVQRILRRYGE